MSTLHRLILTLALLAFAGSAPGGDITDYAMLAPGESVTIGDQGLVIGFEGIATLDGFHLDSRCPSSVVCVWEGNAETDLWATLPGHERVGFQLHTNEGIGPQEVEISGYVIGLSRLEPYPVEPELIPAEDYRLHIVVNSAARVETPDAAWGTLKARYHD